MTTQHPLTEEMMEKIHGDEPGWSNPYDEDDMRSAYDLGFETAEKGDVKYVIRAFSEGYHKGRDDQLEQVIEWLKYYAAVYMYETYLGPCFDEDGLLNDFKKAMRPTNTQENNK